MKVVVTGGAGFIGSHIVRRFREKVVVTVLDDLSSGDLRNLSGSDYTLAEGSILDAGRGAQACQGADCVFHMAAMVSVAESMLRVQECQEV